jgi:hypothetical protein
MQQINSLIGTMISRANTNTNIPMMGNTSGKACCARKQSVLIPFQMPQNIELHNLSIGVNDIDA